MPNIRKHLQKSGAKEAAAISEKLNAELPDIKRYHDICKEVERLNDEADLLKAKMRDVIPDVGDKCGSGNTFRVNLKGGGYVEVQKKTRTTLDIHAATLILKRKGLLQFALVKPEPVPPPQEYISEEKIGELFAKDKITAAELKEMIHEEPLTPSVSIEKRRK